MHGQATLVGVGEESSSNQAPVHGSKCMPAAALACRRQQGKSIPCASPSPYTHLDFRLEAVCRQGVYLKRLGRCKRMAAIAAV